VVKKRVDKVVYMVENHKTEVVDDGHTYFASPSEMLVQGVLQLVQVSD
jgi:hypothetical protein